MASALSARLAWQRKMLRQSLASTLSSNADDALLQVQRKLALDARRNPGKDGFGPRVFAQYMVAAQFAASLSGPTKEPVRVLELGRGYSTVALAWSLPTHVALISVDAKPVSAYDIRVPLERLAGRVRFEDGFTITAAQMGEFYGQGPAATFLGLPAAELRRTMPDFLAPAGGPYAQALDLEGLEGPALEQACLERIFGPDADGNDAVRGLDELLPEIHAGQARFAAPSPPSVLDRLLDESDVLDAVFFDCGEFSSMPEWTVLAGHIRPGGLAVFHDIYFPKSVKNFLVCAAVAASPDWEVLYRDRTTPQGLLVARRRG